MSWKDRLQDASFKGVYFDCIDTSDDVDSALDKSSYPYQDGASVLDLGTSARVIQVRAIFFGDDYEDRLQAFLDALTEGGTGELVHPVFGSIQAVAERRSVRHNANEPDQATVAVTFVEDSASASFFSAKIPSLQASAIVDAGDEAEAAAGELAVATVGRIRLGNPLAPLEDLRAAMMTPLLGGLAKVNGVVASGLDVLDSPRSWVSDIGAVVDSILGLQSFADTAVFDWHSLNGNLDVIRRKVDTGAKPMSAGAVPTETQAGNSVAVYLSVQAASSRGAAAATILGDQVQAPTMTPVEVEAIASEARTEIQAVIDDVWATYDQDDAETIVEPLRDMAQAVQDAARAVIETRPPLVARRLDAPGNLRLVAHRWYGDHERAVELARLNPALASPNHLDTGDVLNGYAA
jgi:prophage DNA circulation protein